MLTLTPFSWQYAGLNDSCTPGSVRWYTAQRTGVHWPAYCCHPAQRTAVIQPNVLLSSSPTYCRHPMQRTGYKILVVDGKERKKERNKHCREKK